MNSKGLPVKLWTLSKEINEKVKEYKKNKQTAKTQQLYLKPTISNFNYKEGALSYGTSYSPEIREEWDFKKLFDFTEKVIKQIPDYHSIALEISKKYEVNEAQADFWLERFTNSITQIAFEELSEEKAIDIISTFTNDLEKGPLDWKTKVHINGFWLQEEEYSIYDGLKIRRPIPSDIAIETPFYFLPLSMETTGFRTPPSAILELEYRAKQEIEVQNEIEKILNCLRLFRLGSIFSIKMDLSPKSILANGGIIGSGQRFSLAYRYPISNKDITKFAELIRRIKILLPKEPLSASSTEIDPINIALQRYNDALLKPESIESKITSTITCFEALYLKAEERMELSHRLGQRVAALLGFFNFTALEVYNNLNRSYDIRSTFIHGSLIKAEKQKDIAQLVEKILNYARISLLLFLQLKSTIDKESLICKIDNSLLDSYARSKLEELLKQNCAIWE
jgi:hypothetical protein